MDLEEIGWGGGVEWIQLAQDRDRCRAVVSAVMNLRVLAPRSLLCIQNDVCSRWVQLAPVLCSCKISYGCSVF
jgi:hypothetical protein